MRESRTFAERTKILASDESIKKYFFVYEGSDTELIYFDAINNLKQDIEISPLIELIPLVRSFGETGWSNPKKILDRVIRNLEESKTGCITYETLLNRIMDYFFEEKLITTSKKQAESIWKTLKWICEENLHKLLTANVDDIESKCNTIVELLQQESELINVVSDIAKIIKNSGITYSEGFDKICLIVDRDRKSFVSKPENNQYEYVLNKCKENNFGFYITNPCFEFWLLLHFDQVHTIDKMQLLKNEKVSKKKCFAEQELKKLLVGYEKSSYNAEELVRNIDKAIVNEKKFCEDPEGLENKIGSNIGLLIEELRK